MSTRDDAAPGPAPRDPLAPDALEAEIRDDARAERRVAWIGLVGVLVTAGVLVLLSVLR
ncbi:hypothetical protein [Cellulomonas gelida]|uniref:Uncharacterized protein n=1 Tax=Cellulomonas gelida TaxID=1712 RepID=A0A4Y3KLH6_9CELL|nr:hypothetical protein [Cellulomonas gelida]GEA83778.1 hypothetical protein CGE01nite_10290 [Cellulomonas gelida]GGL32050.1 hypothetical protein GCM10009774_23170 [Cellulomonas gelida]